MTVIDDLTELQLDALREAFNVGAGNAATALSQMMGQSVMVHVPRLDAIPPRELPRRLQLSGGVVVMSIMQVFGSAAGHVALVAPHRDGRNLSRLLLGLADDDCISFDEMETSTFNEVSNIVGAAYLDALSTLIGTALIPSIPQFTTNGSIHPILERVVGADDVAKLALCAETAFEFRDSGRELSAYLMLFPELGAIDVILRGLHSRIGGML